MSCTTPYWIYWRGTWASGSLAAHKINSKAPLSNISVLPSYLQQHLKTLKLLRTFALYSSTGGRDQVKTLVVRKLVCSFGVMPWAHLCMRCCTCNVVLRSHNYVIFEVFTAVTMKNAGFWDVTPYASCENWIRKPGTTLPVTTLSLSC
jgi:hypothetical protein